MDGTSKAVSKTRDKARFSLPAEPVHIVVVCPSDDDRLMLRDVGQRQGWKLEEARTYREAMNRVAHGRIPVILCESQLPDGSWEDVLSGTATCLIRPRIVVMSRHADERLWVDVLSMGGFDVLAAPFADQEVCRCVELAFRNWWDEAQQEGWRRRLTGVTADTA
jgi:DNA-binding NtrC family response regulator